MKDGYLDRSVATQDEVSRVARQIEDNPEDRRGAGPFLDSKEPARIRRKLLQPFESILAIPQSDIDERKRVGRHISFLGDFPQLIEDFERLGAGSATRVGMRQRRKIAR
jgi:hypothetical protein